MQDNRVRRVSDIKSALAHYEIEEYHTVVG